MGFDWARKTDRVLQSVDWYARLFPLALSSYWFYES
jgi:hypothetical protein